MIASRGVSGVTHRSVTETAGVPLATVSYFFDTIETLTSEAIRTLTARRIDDSREQVEREANNAVAGSDVSHTVADNRLSDRAQIMAMVEGNLHAAREPSMRPLVGEMLSSFDEAATASLEVAGSTSTRATARSFVALVDGFTLHPMASESQEVSTSELDNALAALLLGELVLEGRHERAADLRPRPRRYFLAVDRCAGPHSTKVEKYF